MRRKRPGARTLSVCERYGLEVGTLWTPVPLALRTLVNDRALGLAAYVVLIEILDVYHPMFGGLVPFSASAVGRRLSLDRRHVGRVLDELAAAGLVTIDRPTGGHMVLHVDGLLLALRLAASTTCGRSWLPMLQSVGDVRSNAAADLGPESQVGGTRVPWGTGPESQVGGTRVPPAGSAENQSKKENQNEEHAHIAKILDQLGVPKKRAAAGS